jgi:hypothetical protein
VPDLLRYQLRDGPHAGEPTAERGEIERLARECRAARCEVGLDSIVLETRLNVVRSSVPETVTTTRRLARLPASDSARAVWLVLTFDDRKRASAGRTTSEGSRASLGDGPPDGR